MSASALATDPDAEAAAATRAVLGPLTGRSPLALGAGVAASFVAVFALLFGALFQLALEGSRERAQQAMADLALALASQVDVEAHERLLADADTGGADYHRVLDPLSDMLGVLEGIRNVYTLRAGPDGQVHYVLDTAHAPALRSRSTSVTRVGQAVGEGEIEPAMLETVAGGGIYFDAGTYVEGGVELRGLYAPLRAGDGRVVAVLGIDYEESHYVSAIWRWALPLIGTAFAILAVVSALLGAVVYLLRARLGRILEERHHESIRDGLTGLYNRRFFNDRLQREVEAARAGGEALCLLVFDADHFKRINDTLGHPAGDEVLVMIAAKLCQCLRAGDVACRIGGEEFAVIMPGTGTAEGEAAFRRLGAAIREPFDVAGTRLVVTVSGGIAAFGTHADAPGDLLSRADEALYVAKQGGRDWCVVAAGAPGAAR